MTGTCVYAIIPTAKEVYFTVEGLDSDKGDIRAIHHGGLGAVVGRGELTECRGLTKEEAVRRLLAHERVVESVMQRFPLLPVKFGTVLRDEAAVSRLLAQGESIFRHALQRFANVIQTEIVVTWDLAEVFAEIGREEPIMELKLRISGRPASETVDERIALGQMAQAALERRRAGLRDYLVAELRKVALDAVINAPMDDYTVANVGLLVCRGEGHGMLDRKLERLDAQFGGRLNFRCVGPLPPYSFATVEVQAPSFEELGGARRRLGLREVASLEEIGTAFRRLASRIHPDVNPGDPRAEERMAELNRAHQLVKAYAESQIRDETQDDGTPGGNGGRRANPTCRFSRQAVERTLLVGIRRYELS